MCYWSCGLESCSVPFRVNTKTSVTALICWLHPLPIKAGKIQKSEILCSQAAVMPAANEPLVFTWCKERAVYKRNDQCLYCWDAAVFSWLPKLDGIQLPALLLWGAVLAVSALLCYGSLWKSSGFVEWERGCALQKLHCEANVSVHVPVPNFWESSSNGAAFWRLWSLNLLSVLFSCWFLPPSWNKHMHTYKPWKRKQRMYLNPLLHWARSSWLTQFWGTFCKKQDCLGVPSKQT